ncbi:MAG TPA: head GIN domain-containing protein [Hanamia sp.]|jgi:hypothetical protein|nr:head GIN domain-containing protein [Hanamia sp.]
MMKYIFLLFTTATLFISCATLTGNGKVTEENRDISNIYEVNTSGSIDVVIRNGDHYALTIQDDANLLPYVITNVDNGVLTIHYKDGYSVIRDHAKAIVTAPTLQKISSSGSADITTEGLLKNDNQIEVSTSGSGDIIAELDAPRVSVSGSGSGDITLSGRTKDFDCRMSGSGDVKCANLKSENADIHVSGSSDVHTFASVSLKVNVTGSGDVYYGGNPTSPEIHITGSGTAKAVQ